MVSVAARRLGLEERLVYHYCKKLGLKKKLVDYGWTKRFTYDITEEHLKVMLPPTIRQNSMTAFCKRFGYHRNFVVNVALKTGTSYQDTKRLIVACRLRKSGNYTWKGINQILGNLTTS